jgi:hypothetical protein
MSGWLGGTTALEKEERNNFLKNPEGKTKRCMLFCHRNVPSGWYQG